jgi:hypothetical protein
MPSLAGNLELNRLARDERNGNFSPIDRRLFHGAVIVIRFCVSRWNFVNASEE